MVGALADWFAVTALFRRPLGLPIPHTAIVVARKEQFGQTLAVFFRENFLSGAAVAERMRSSASVARASAWLADREHATTMVRNVLTAQRGRARRPRGAGGRRDRQRAAPGDRRVPLTEVSATILRAVIESPQLDDGIEAMCTAADASSSNAATAWRRCSRPNVPGGSRRRCNTALRAPGRPDRRHARRHRT